MLSHVSHTSADGRGCVPYFWKKHGSAFFSMYMEAQVYLGRYVVLKYCAFFESLLRLVSEPTQLVVDMIC